MHHVAKMCKQLQHTVATSPVEDAIILHVLQKLYEIAHKMAAHKVPEASLTLQQDSNVVISLLAELQSPINDAD